MAVYEPRLSPVELRVMEEPVDHGDGLTGGERRDAVRRLLEAHPEWADRRIGELCRISPKTVALLRAELRPSTVGGGDDVRVGRDGRARPVDASWQRARIAEELSAAPDASLRTIAARVGVSPETVRSVRASRRASEMAGPARAEADSLDEGRCDDLPAPWDAAAPGLFGDDMAEGFLERTDVGEADIWAHASAIPLSRVYEVADEARRRAEFWSSLANCVEGRVRQPGHR